MRPQHGKLNIQGRVEHCVGRLLEGEYPLVFSLTYVLPLGDGLLCRVGTFVVVADDAPQQAVVAHGYPVVVVYGYAGEGRDVDLVLQRVIDLLREQGVQGVDAFDDEHCVTAQFQFFPVVLALARHEVVFRYFYPFSGHQSHQVILHQMVVHRLDVVEVIVAVG